MRRGACAVLVGAVFVAAALGCKKKEAPESVAVVVPPPAISPEAAKGAAVFRDKCSVCHKIGAVGGTIGTDLTQVGKRHDGVFLQTLLRDPATYYPKGVKMPAYKDMPKEEMDALIAYLLTLK